MPSSWFEPLPARATYQAEAHAENRAALAEAAAAACARTAPTLLAMQKPEGYWWAISSPTPRSSPTTCCCSSGCTRREDGEWNPPTRGRIEKARRAILERQLPDGGFNIYPDGPADVNATVKAYIALKLAGLDPRSEPLQRARERDPAPGRHPGGQQLRQDQPQPLRPLPARHVPTIPPEMVLLPGGLIYEMSSWTRAIVVPLSIVQAQDRTRARCPRASPWTSWSCRARASSCPKRDRLSALFRQLDSRSRCGRRSAPERIRRPAIREAEQWMLDRTRYSDGLGAIYPVDDVLHHGAGRASATRATIPTSSRRIRSSRAC